MKDQTDTQTAELFPEPAPKRRGRPVTGKARTGAQRQRDLRFKKERANQLLLNVWVDISVISSLDRFASVHGVDRSAMLSKLLNQADDKFQRCLGIGSDDWEKYLDKTLHATENPKE